MACWRRTCLIVTRRGMSWAGNRRTLAQYTINSTLTRLLISTWSTLTVLLIRLIIFYTDMKYCECNVSESVMVIAGGANERSCLATDKWLASRLSRLESSLSQLCIPMAYITIYTFLKRTDKMLIFDCRHIDCTQLAPTDATRWQFTAATGYEQS